MPQSALLTLLELQRHPCVLHWTDSSLEVLIISLLIMDQRDEEPNEGGAQVVQ